MHIEIDGASALIHNSGLLEDSSGGAHGGIAGGWGTGQVNILRSDASLLHEGLLLLLDSGIDVDLGLAGLGFGDIRAGAVDGGENMARASPGTARGQSPLADARSVSPSSGGSRRHDG